MIGRCDDAAIDEQVIKTLECSGKCHNWCLITLYHCSNNKFFSYSLLTPFRWEVWLLCVGLCAGYFYEIHNIELFLDPIFAGVTVLDLLNLNHERITENRAHNMKVLGGWYLWHEFGKLVLLLIIEVILTYFALSVTYQFVGLVACNAFVCVLLYYFYKTDQDGGLPVVPQEPVSFMSKSGTSQ